MFTKRTEWEGEEFRLVRLQGLRQNTAFPRGNTPQTFFSSPGRRLNRIYIWSTGGARGHAEACAEAWADFCVASGMPAQPHTFFIPSTLASVESKFEIYRLWADDFVTYHTQLESADSVSVCLAGRFSSRWSADEGLEPDPEQLEALEALVKDYLLPRYGLEPDAVRGGFDAGFATEPGDALEGWVRSFRGEEWGSAPEDIENGSLPLHTARQRDQALHDLGHPVQEGPMRQRAALEAFQRRIPWIQVTGRWDTPTLLAARVELSKLSSRL